MITQPIEAFPLHWPQGFERNKSQTVSSFKCTLGQARDGVLQQIHQLKGTNIIISSNIPLKKDGNMYASLKPIDNDHGVAVYFTWKNDQYVLACDKYYQIWENLRAIEKSIDAIRALDRWGASDILARAFTGFKAIGGAKKENWWDVLGVEETANYNEKLSAYKWLIKKYHPDNQSTGDHDMFIKIQEAYSIATK